MSKKNQTLNDVANAATAAGMTYGKYQQRNAAKMMEESRQRLKDSQPVHVVLTDAYLCPTCGAMLEQYRNCSACGKVIIWRKAAKN